MVTPAGIKRNSLYASLVELDKKLEELGLVEVNGKIVLMGSEEYAMLNLLHRSPSPLDLLTSRLFNEETFYPVFTKDLNKCLHEVI